MSALLVLALLPLPSPRCATTPVPGPVLASFAPGPGFAGHWGMDLEAAVGTPVQAAMAGTVTFAAHVVDNLSVTVAHGGTLRTSYSFLSSTQVMVGDPVQVGDRLGRTGRAHGSDALHFSLRLGDRYLDPGKLFVCGAFPGPALRLVSGTARRPIYAVRRATRNPGRNLRSTSRGPSHGGGGNPAFA